MLIPRFSLRLLLLVITVSSVFFFAITLATRGHQWAQAVTVAIGSLFIVFFLHATVFSLAWLITVVGGLFSSNQAASSPFAYQKPPPQQIVPPEDTE